VYALYVCLFIVCVMLCVCDVRSSSVRTRVESDDISAGNDELMTASVNGAAAGRQI